MTDQLTMTDPADVRVAWPKVRERIAAIQAECKEPWLPEDVFVDLLNGQAFLWGTSDFSGFLVLQVASFLRGRELHCWICCNDSPVGVAAYWPQLLEIARMNECGRITFENDRRGFQRVLPFLRVRYLYSAPVE